jgi:hypothetical protein
MRRKPDNKIEAQPITWWLCEMQKTTPEMRRAEAFM